MRYDDATRAMQVAAALAVCLTLAACQNGASDGDAPAKAAAGNPDHGKLVFATTCSTCHAADGTGVRGLGKDLVHSEWVKGTADGDLAQMITNGRGANDPLSTTKIAMPAKGGNGSLSDQDIADSVAYLRTISKPN